MSAPIECANFGSAAGPQLYLTLGALVIAALSLAMNFVQLRQAQRRLRAFAVFEIELRTIGAGEDGVLRVGEGRCSVLVEATIRNVGRKAAGETLINARAPREEAGSLRWSGPRGAELPGGEESRGEPPGTLRHPDGRELAISAISRKLPRLGIGPMCPVHFKLEVEAPAEGELVIAVSVLVHADEIERPLEAFRADHLVRVGR